MSYRLPCVAVRLKSLEDHLRHGKNSLSADNPGPVELADFVKYLFERPNKFQEFGDNGYDLVNCYYQWPLVAERILLHASENSS